MSKPHCCVAILTARERFRINVEKYSSAGRDLVTSLATLIHYDEQTMPFGCAFVHQGRDAGQGNVVVTLRPCNATFWKAAEIECSGVWVERSKELQSNRWVGAGADFTGR